MTIEHVVTSGCSFSETGVQTWPHFLHEYTKIPVYNWGQSGAGNGWISRTIIYQLQNLLNDGVDPKSILAIAMWSSIDRTSIFVSKDNFDPIDTLVKDHQQRLPLQFLKSRPNSAFMKNNIFGFLEGSGHLGNIDSLLYKKFLEVFKHKPNQFLAIESYEHFLRVQWFCQSKNIRLINLTFADIMHYPTVDYTKVDENIPTSSEYYPHVKNLSDMIDFENWIFFNKTGGLFEYVRDNKLPFKSDGNHPRPNSHQHYVENFLVPKLKEKEVL